jgi:hypothetical protein
MRVGPSGPARQDEGRARRAGGATTCDEQPHADESAAEDRAEPAEALRRQRAGLENVPVPELPRERPGETQAGGNRRSVELAGAAAGARVQSVLIISVWRGSPRTPPRRVAHFSPDAALVFF